jgi:lanosterol synthase
MVYIPMSYLYGIRFKAPENELILSLREVGHLRIHIGTSSSNSLLKELFVEGYDTIDWPSQRNNIAAVDIYSPHTTLLDVTMAVLGAYEECSIPFLRKRALGRAYDLICKEDDNTSYQCLGPVNKMLNLVCRAHVEGPGSEAFRRHEIKRLDFMWLGAEGMMMCGTNGSQLWDTSFISQALVETGLANEEDNREAAFKALKWLDECQIRENPMHYASSYRHTTKGAWPFSTKEQGYTVSDCTGEGLKAVIYLQEHIP